MSDIELSVDDYVGIQKALKEGKNGVVKLYPKDCGLPSKT